MTKQDMFERGARLVRRFCETNSLPIPAITSWQGGWRVSECAYYRKSHGIIIHLPSCANIGRGGRAWSYPGHWIDRTPYGVLAHECGHHVDVILGEARDDTYYSEWSKYVREVTDDMPLTGYCPNDAEWFAEMMRLFITNPSLLRRIRRNTFLELRSALQPVERRGWRTVLADAPERTRDLVNRRITTARRIR